MFDSFFTWIQNAQNTTKSTTRFLKATKLFSFVKTTKYSIHSIHFLFLFANYSIHNWMFFILAHLTVIPSRQEFFAFVANKTKKSDLDISNIWEIHDVIFCEVRSPSWNYYNKCKYNWQFLLTFALIEICGIFQKNDWYRFDLELHNLILLRLGAANLNFLRIYLCYKP